MPPAIERVCSRRREANEALVMPERKSSPGEFEIAFRGEERREFARALVLWRLI